MFYIITASADTYITNKIIKNSFKAEDANVGRAATLDLFKLYNESTYLSGSDTNRERVTGSIDEISRLLIKFDYSALHDLTGSLLNINHGSFKVKLELQEMIVGAPTPRDFYVVAYPLSQSFNEGVGKDVATFGDIDVANFLTSSYSSGTAVTWNLSGSGAGGRKGGTSLDYIPYGTVGSSVIDFGATQYFEEGPGPLIVDVTKVVSSTMAGDLSNHGFRISFSGSYESDQKTRFAKRFASRHVRDVLVRPRLIATWDDSIDDAHKDLVFNSSASFFLKNTIGGSQTNFVSGAALTELRGQNCMLLRFVSSSGHPTLETSIYVTASQLTSSTSTSRGTPGIKGIYSASFLLNQFSSTFFNTLKSEDELTLKEIWSSMDKTVGYYTGSVKIRKSSVSPSAFANRSILVSALGSKAEYRVGSKISIRLFIEDLDANAKLKAYKLPREAETLVFDKAYYRIRSEDTNAVVVPFDKKTGSTRVSTDGDGMFVEFKTNGLPKNKQMTVDLLVIDRGTERMIPLPAVSFRVIS